MKTFGDTSLELTRQDGSNDGSQNMFLWRSMANYPCYSSSSGALNIFRIFTVALIFFFNF